MHVTLWSKPDCPLCDELKADLLAMQEEIGFSLEERNIQEDAAAWARFQYLIPVLDIADGPLLYPPHTWSSVYSALQQCRD
ncbi:MAG: glutaredoxin family protein [Caldilineaceae bacterium]|nr:glutaredoxin family protein [Caldilineaceae bacterium]MCB9158320.1 glutaredoxin family protein [Caldilineaceae bacterium]MCB9162605.1 glutaredoxin family protein [Caldilineaceae bacterium]